jgi:hypothetical protein
MIVICLQCRDKEHKIQVRELQIDAMHHSLCAILVAANQVLQKENVVPAEEVLLAIAGEAAKYV